MLLSKTIKFFCVCILLSVSTFSYSETKNITDVLDFNSDIIFAVDALIKEIKFDHNNNKDLLSSRTEYKDLTLVSVDPNFKGSFEIDDKTKLIKSFEISNLSFQVTGFSLFLDEDYTVAINLFVKLSEQCTKIVEGSRVYTIVESNDSIIDKLFKKDLTGYNYNSKYYAYGDAIYESIFRTNSKIHQLCPNFLSHTHSK